MTPKQYCKHCFRELSLSNLRHLANWELDRLCRECQTPIPMRTRLRSVQHAAEQAVLSVMLRIRNKRHATTRLLAYRAYQFVDLAQLLIDPGDNLGDLGFRTAKNWLRIQAEHPHRAQFDRKMRHALRKFQRKS